MFASVLSAAIRGMEVCPIYVEADVSDGLPSFTMVGFPSTQVREAQDRVRTAIRNSEITLPPKRITVNLLPTDMKKEGAGFDLPVAAAILSASGMIPTDCLRKVMIVGELSLNGAVNAVSGILPRIIRARELGCRYCIIPHDNLKEASLVEDMPLIGVKTLQDMLQGLSCPSYSEPMRIEEMESICNDAVDFEEIIGQENVKRAAEIAVSGFHNFMMTGTPGSGKTMIARRIPTIMPDLSFDEKLELTKIYSVAGLLSREQPLIQIRPFRSPHHTTTASALSGGGFVPRPGEITLSHRGVLFLDEMPEFSRRSLEVLRQPLEDKNLHIARVGGTYTFPANFMLVAAMNPCPCGYYPNAKCQCSFHDIKRYQGKISRPLLDRIDLCVEVPEVNYEELLKKSKGESSAQIRQRVERVLQIQKERYKSEGICFNGELHGSQVEKYCVFTKEADTVIEDAFRKMNLSARGYHRVLKVARTIADMEMSEQIERKHMLEALSYRSLDRN
ncbi:MAG: YifB family Mg chelatase-like AAA ATPase [Blautia sp.]|nr:YifB family Mg chelatase-like AAA ATPase [Blautia sp.]